ncbi:DUF1349 domain-containing protein [Saccharothrix variisporea]|uniref:DUF1349 domain-containing protein n=1 Tax=Saccharothrix variisporea TaxID=543527 RepID=A0A495X697_9PSEU|nr:hypothetical protein [Saccharothrix variisporea]RKT68564.1 hypothetical protein DFJ66_1756 [Saccharothrix variisporea]
MRTPVVAAVAALLLIALPGLLLPLLDRSSCSEGTVEVECPTDPVGPDGTPVSDRFFVMHRPLGVHGSITARVASMEGTITYPPPDHDKIVPGLVPWAKAGVIVKDGLAQGSSYAALMLTGAHGVRMQHDYVHDTAGSATARWLRLSRDGDVVTGEDSVDGVSWTRVGSVRLSLPDTVLVGLFVTSPGDLTVRDGASQVRFTQATGVFDHVVVDGPAASWTSAAVGGAGTTDWEKFHRAAGGVESGGTFTVTGSGDIGPLPGPSAAGALVGLILAVVVLVLWSVRWPFVVGVVGAGAAVVFVDGVPWLTLARVVLGVGVFMALVAAYSWALRGLLRRWVAVVVALGTVVVPYVVALVVPGLGWLLRVTPAAGFSVVGTRVAYPQVVDYYAPAGGYFPLPWWAGLAVLGGYAAVLIGLRRVRTGTRTA